jgi:hypothetical protein
MEKNMSRVWIAKSILLIIIIALMTAAGSQLYKHRHYRMPIVAGPGVTKVVKLSDYAEGLKGTIADTNVFLLEGKEEGGKLLIMANTHSNEPAAILTALIFVENAVVDKGTLIIIPEFNNSAGRNTRPGDGYPLYYEIPTDWGSKKFRMGNRDASPLAVFSRRQEHQQDLAWQAQWSSHGAGYLRSDADYEGGESGYCHRYPWS